MNWRQTFDPFVCSCWGYFAAADPASPRSDSCGSQTRSRETFALILTILLYQIWRISSLLCCCVPLFTVNGDQWLLSPHLYEEMVLLLACKKQGKHLKSQNSVRIWDSVDFEELEFLNFKFLICFVHLTCLALVLILVWRKFEIALHLAHKTFSPNWKKKNNS